MFCNLYKPQYSHQKTDVTSSALGIFYILGLVVYPAGWGAQRVQKLCGHEAAPFFPAECNLGKSFLSCIIGDHSLPYLIITNLVCNMQPWGTLWPLRFLNYLHEEMNQWNLQINNYKLGNVFVQHNILVYSITLFII